MSNRRERKDLTVNLLRASLSNGCWVKVERTLIRGNSCFIPAVLLFGKIFEQAGQSQQLLQVGRPEWGIAASDIVKTARKAGLPVRWAQWLPDPCLEQDEAQKHADQPPVLAHKADPWKVIPWMLGCIFGTCVEHYHVLLCATHRDHWWSSSMA